MSTTKLGFLVCGLLVATLASAQTVVNPLFVSFDHTDYATTDSYVVGYFSSATATTPVQEGALPKPVGCNPCQGALPSRPSAFQTWYVGVRAVAGTQTSVWSAPLVPFERVPVAPTGVLLTR